MSAIVNQLPPAFDHLQRRAFIVAVVAWIICVIGYFADPVKERFFTAYLFAFLFPLGLSMGALGNVMLHHQTGGAWGKPVRGISEAAMMLAPLTALFFLPLLLGLNHLYEWANPSIVAAKPELWHPAEYFRPGLFALRGIICLVVWSVLALVLGWASARYQERPTPRLAQFMRRLSGAGILIYTLTLTMAIIDWVMSRESHWSSTVMGFIFLVGQALSAMAFTVIMLRALVEVKPLHRYLNSRVLNDLGNLLLTMVILWSYMSFAQLIVVYAGNIRGETVWYIRRGMTWGNGWRILGTLLIVLHFFIPFFLLLFRKVKRRFNFLTGIAIVLLAMRAVDLYYLSAPTSLHDGLGEVSWLTPFPLIALTATWLGCFIAVLRRRPLSVRLEAQEEPIIRHGDGRPQLA